MGLPCLQIYYYAAQLRPLLCLCTQAYSARWKEIEHQVTEGIPLEAILTDEELKKKTANKGNQWFNLSLKIWQETIKLCRLEVPAKLLRWCAYDSNFLQIRFDDRFKKWTTKGLTNYYTFVHRGAFQIFGSLQRKYDLEKSDFFRYLQVRHYFVRNLSTALKTEELGILKLFLSASKSTTCINTSPRCTKVFFNVNQITHSI